MKYYLDGHVINYMLPATTHWPLWLWSASTIDLLGKFSKSRAWDKVREEQQQRPFNGLWSGTTRVGRYQKKHSPTHTHPDHRASFIIFVHLQRSMVSSLFNLRAWQSSRTTSFQVFFGLPLGLEHCAILQSSLVECQILSTQAIK